MMTSEKASSDKKWVLRLLTPLKAQHSPNTQAKALAPKDPGSVSALLQSASIPGQNQGLEQVMWEATPAERKSVERVGNLLQSNKRLDSFFSVGSK